MELTKHTALVDALERGFWQSRIRYLDEEAEREPEPYEPKAGFSVEYYQANQWFAHFNQPTFPDEELQDYLTQQFFSALEVDDECTIIVTVNGMSSKSENHDYIAESIDHAIAYLKLFKEHERLHHVLAEMDKQIKGLKQTIGIFTEKCSRFAIGYL